MSDEVVVRLTRTEVNRLTAVLRDSAYAKVKASTRVHENDKADLLAAAEYDQVLRRKLIGAKAVSPHAVFQGDAGVPG